MFKKEILIIILLALLCACASSLKMEVNKYQGDGVIKFSSWSYLPFCNVEGFTINFPEIDLSKEHHESYKLNLLPPNRKIMLYFVVEEEGRDRSKNASKLTSRNCNGVLSLQVIDSKSHIVVEINKKIKELTEYSIDNHWTWMHDGANSMFNPLPDENYTLMLYYDPNGYNNNKNGYLFQGSGSFLSQDFLFDFPS